MALDKDHLEVLAQDLLGRTGLEQDLLRKTARRLDGLIRELRALDEAALQHLPPAFSFAPPGPLHGEASAPAQAPAASDQSVPPGGTDLLALPAATLAELIRRRAISPVELTRSALERIAARNDLNAFVTVMADQAMAAAREAEREEPRGPLHGVPVALKDLYEVSGVRTTAGSSVLACYVSERDATVVRRLREAGAILIGKTATHEFAYGCTTDSPFQGPTRNPCDPVRSPGGSSGGSGAAVGAGIVPVAMGTDTAGSIRIPAACCGVVGLKPTYGRVSRSGIIPLSWSLDHAGPLTRSVTDAAVALEVTAGFDPEDPATTAGAIAGCLTAAPQSLQGVRIGLPAAWLDGPTDDAVAVHFRQTLDRLRSLGADLVEVEMPSLDLCHLVSRVLTLAEAGAYHAPYLTDRAGQYSPEVRERLELGQYVLARDYLLAQRLRGEVTRKVNEAMTHVAALVTPAVPILPPLIGERVHTYADGRQESPASALLRFVAPFNVTGHPAIVLPCGASPDGLPVAIQLVGPPCGEPALLRLALALEAAQPGL